MIILCTIQPSDIEVVFHLIGWIMLSVIILGLFIAIVIALLRWVLRINEQIELLSQIRDELKILNSSGNEDI